MCERLLANPVIETYRISLADQADFLEHAPR